MDLRQFFDNKTNFNEVVLFYDTLVRRTDKTKKMS